MPETATALHMEIERLRNDLEKKKEDNKLTKEISELLYQLRIPANIKGFQLLQEAIKKVYDEQPLDLYTTLLYKELAQKFNDTPARIEF